MCKTPKRMSTPYPQRIVLKVFFRRIGVLCEVEVPVWSRHLSSSGYSLPDRVPYGEYVLPLDWVFPVDTQWGLRYSVEQRFFLE